MSFVVLTKANGLTCGLPVASIEGVLSTALDGSGHGDGMRSVVVSSLRGGSFPALAHTGAEAFDEIEKAGGDANWICLSCGEDATRLRPYRIRGFDQVNEAHLVVFYEKPNGEDGSAPVNNTDENVTRLTAALKGAAA